MAMSTFEALLPFFPSAELVFLQGWGEPLLHPRFWDMARRTVAAGARVGFTTGGSILDRRSRGHLLDSGVEILGVTLAGATAETHDRFRGGSPLDLLHKNLLALKEEKERAGLDTPRLHLAYQLLAENVQEVPQVAALAERWGAVQVVVSPLSLVLTPEMEEQSLHARLSEETIPSGIRDLPKVRNSSGEILNRVEELLDRAEEVARARGIDFCAYRIRTGARETTCRENVLRSCFVSADGEVSPCVMTNVGLWEGGSATHRFRGEDRPLPFLSFGNVNHRPLPEIWHSTQARAFRAILPM